MLREARGAVWRAITHVINSTTIRSGMQFAALPYRIDAGGRPEVMLVTSRETRRWVIPKGWSMKDLRPSRVAEREAYEEAGLIGCIIGSRPIGVYRYDKRLPDSSQRCQVWVFALRVEHQLDDWPEKSQRDTRWFGIDEAASIVSEDGLREIIRLSPQSIRQVAAGDARACLTGT